MAKKQKREYVKAADMAASVHVNFTPWCVTLFERRSPLDPFKCYPVIYYVRAEDPAKAAVKAHIEWTLAQQHKGNYGEYPKLADRAPTERMTDKQYMNEWRIAQRFPHAYGGHASNPTWFTFEHDSRYRPVNIRDLEELTRPPFPLEGLD
jgi:hypothetical protein